MTIKQMKEALAPIIKRMPGYVKLAAALYKDEGLSKSRKALLAGALAYAISPIDLVPGFIPVAGQLDDIIVALAGLKMAMRGLTADARSGYEEQFGITLNDIEGDLQAAKQVGLAMAGKVLKYSARTLFLVGKGGIKTVRKIVGNRKEDKNEL